MSAKKNNTTSNNFLSYMYVQTYIFTYCFSLFDILDLQYLYWGVLSRRYVDSCQEYKDPMSDEVEFLLYPGTKHQNYLQFKKQ